MADPGQDCDTRSFSVAAPNIWKSLPPFLRLRSLVVITLTSPTSKPALHLTWRQFCASDLCFCTPCVRL